MKLEEAFNILDKFDLSINPHVDAIVDPSEVYNYFSAMLEKN